MLTERATYPGHRSPAAVIHLAVWLYQPFSLSLRDVELILAKRGVVVSYESCPAPGLMRRNGGVEERTVCRAADQGCR